MPNWKRIQALLAQDYASLIHQIKHVLPEDWLLDASQEDFPPRIMLVFGKTYEGPYSKILPQFEKPIKMVLHDEDLEVMGTLLGKILPRFPQLKCKFKNEQGLLIYKLWIEES